MLFMIYIPGARNRPNEALQMITNQTINFPELSDPVRDLSKHPSWTVSLYVAVDYDVNLILIPGTLDIIDYNLR